jgi:CelD/BcsL family acetyltransferase involved in cellulose biosynthesis
MHVSRSCDSSRENVGVRYTVDSVSTEEGLSALEADWNRLSETAEHPNVFMTYDWCRTWTRWLGQDHPGSRYLPHVLVLKNDETVVGIAPLARRVASRIFRIRKLEFSTIHADYNDLVLGDDLEGQTEAVVEYLSLTSSKWDIIDLRHLRDAGNAIARLKGALARAGLPYRIFLEDQRCPYVSIDSPWSMMRKKRRLYFARRAFAGFSEKASEGFTVRVVENPQTEPGLYERLIAIEAQKCIEGKPTQPFLGEYREVFQSLFATSGPLGWIAVVLVESDRRLIAYRLLYRCGNKLWDYQHAYDRDFSDLSPGTVAVCAAIDYGFEHGFDEFDFLIGEESHKLRWTSDLRQTYRLLVWNRHQRSRFWARAYLKLRARALASTRIEYPKARPDASIGE